MAEISGHAPLARDAMAYVLAGGRGSRLMELTDKRAKPAVFFGGKTRIVDFADRIISFIEKPKDPPPIPGQPDLALASMGIYVFDTAFIVDQLRRDADDPTSSHDFGKDIIPYVVKNGKAYAHRFTKSCVRSAAESGSYWRDVGTVDAYWEGNIDLTDIVP